MTHTHTPHLDRAVERAIAKRSGLCLTTVRAVFDPTKHASHGKVRPTTIRLVRMAMREIANEAHNAI